VNDKTKVQLVSAILAYPLKAWFLMLALGGIHDSYTEVPAIGYGVSLLVVIAADALFGWDRGSSDN
jgi:hypothetical protein